LNSFSEKQANVEMCTKQLERATELIGGLGGEGERWLVAAEKLAEVNETLTGFPSIFHHFLFKLQPSISSRRRSHRIWRCRLPRSIHQRLQSETNPRMA
jgi:hypothetical protein